MGLEESLEISCFEKEKLKLLDQESLWNRIEETPVFVLCEIAGLPVQFRLQGFMKAEMGNFLNDYLGPFLLPAHSKRALIEISYEIEDQDISNRNLAFWNETRYEYRIHIQSNGSQFVAHRDFIARVEKNGLSAKVRGPFLDFSTSDTVDNILTLLISRQLPQQDALALHASTVEKNGFAFVFFGASGAGKSTLAHQCFHLDGLKVLSGDQIYLSLKDGLLMAHPCATSIPEFPRGHRGWCSSSLPVKGLIHLVQKNEFKFRPMGPSETLVSFLRETIYQHQFGGAEKLLELAIAMVSTSNIQLGEMSYPKGTSFWSLFDHF
jgi:hypothetical protein